MPTGACSPGAPRKSKRPDALSFSGKAKIRTGVNERAQGATLIDTLWFQNGKTAAKARNLASQASAVLVRDILVAGWHIWFRAKYADGIRAARISATLK